MSRHHRALDRKRWESARVRALDRDGWRCVRCGTSRSLEVDHVEPLHLGRTRDPYDVTGLQTLCRTCHAAKSAAELRPSDPIRDRWRALVARFADF